MFNVVRPQITSQAWNETYALAVKRLAQARKIKGDGVFVSRHEILGALGEEYRKAREALDRKVDHQVVEELLDLAVVCLAAVASYAALPITWRGTRKEGP